MSSSSSINLSLSAATPDCIDNYLLPTTTMSTAAEIRDEEDGTLCAFRLGCCAGPFDALRRPIEVEDLFDSGY